MGQKNGHATRVAASPSTKNEGTPGTEFRKAWRKAMTGDQKALDSLLPLALQADPDKPEGQAARRLISRAYQEQASRLEAESTLLPEPAASELRRHSRTYFYKSVLAAHVDLKAVEVADAMAMVPEPSGELVVDDDSAVGCLLDPPPGAPSEVLATNQSGLLGLIGTVTGVAVHWTAPDDHGHAITSYSVNISPPAPSATMTISGTTAQIILLPPGTFVFTVKAVNSDGIGPNSAPSNPVTIGQPPPDPCGAVTSRNSAPGGGLAVVEWAAPAKGGPFTSYRVTAYDATSNQPVSRKDVSGNVLGTAFTDLAKGSYKFGVRVFNAGGFANEVVTPSALSYTPPAEQWKPSDIPSFTSDSLLKFDLTKSLLDPDLVRNRLGGALEQANKWRYEYLKALGIKAAGDALQYEQYIGHLMQMALSKVNAAELLLSPVLQTAIDTINKDVKSLKELGALDKVQDLIKQVGDAAATVMSLEGMIMFLLDNSPLEFWIGLFKGMILDIACIDTNLGHTEKFLKDYLNAGVVSDLRAELDKLKKRVDKMVDTLAAPLEQGVKEIVDGTGAVLGEVLQSFGNPMLISSGSPVPGDPPPPSPLAPLENLLKSLEAEVKKLVDGIKETINKGLDSILNGESLLIKLIKDFIVYPILGAMVISFILGGIAAGILSAIVLAAGVELTRLVIRLLTGPLLGLIGDAKKKLLDLVGQFRGIFEHELAVLDNPLPNLQMIRGNLTELRELLPEAFLSDAAALIGEARRAVLYNAKQLALAAERALGLEHGTAFDIIAPSYDSLVTRAPQLPGGSDPTFLAGAAMLHDFNRMDRVRTELTEGKELVYTHRLSLFRLLGGVGEAAGAVGESANQLAQLLGGGKLLVRLSEEVLVDRYFPGLYRVLISDIKPVGVFGAATSLVSSLPVTLPLTITHMGSGKTRVRNNANPLAPPLRLRDVLKRTADQLILTLFDIPPQTPTPPPGSPPGPPPPPSVRTMVDDAIVAAVNAVTAFSFGPLARPVYRYWMADQGWQYSFSDNLYNGTPPKDPNVWYAYDVFFPGAVILQEMRRNVDPKDYFYTNLLGNEYPVVVKSFTITANRFNIYPKDTPGTAPLFRFGHKGVQHFYTTDEAEGLAQPDLSPEDVPAGVLTSAARLHSTIPAGSTNQTQILDSLMKTLPGQLGAFLADKTDGLLDAATVAKTVRRVLERIATRIPEDKVNDDQTITKAPDLLTTLRGFDVAGALLNGYPALGSAEAAKVYQAVPGLGRLLAEAHQKALYDEGFRIAKWGGADLRLDRDPQIRALGFATLEQKFAPETAVYNLLPSADPVSGRLSAPPSSADAGAPTATPETMQYRTFENRPIEGDLLLAMEVPVPVGTIVDLLLEITVRGCYDENLAAAVRASKSLRSGVLERANAVAAGVNRVLSLPGSAPTLDQGQTALRTFNLSLRAHHENLRQMALVAAASVLGKDQVPGKGTKVEGLLFDFPDHGPTDSLKGLVPLRDDSGNAITSITYQFQRQRSPSLSSLAQTMPLTPDMFGVSLKSIADLGSQAQSLLGSAVGEIAGIGIAIIPTADGAAQGTDNRALVQAVTAQIDPLLMRLLPELNPANDVAAGQPPPSTKLLTEPLYMTYKPADQKLGWGEVWNKVPDGPGGTNLGSPFLKLELGQAIQKNLIHDVIFSIAVRLPVPRLAMSSGVV